MKRDDGNRVRYGEFMECFNEVCKLHAKREDFWVIDRLEQFLELRKCRNKYSVGAFHKRLRCVLNQINRIARNGKWALVGL